MDLLELEQQVVLKVVGAGSTTTAVRHQLLRRELLLLLGVARVVHVVFCRVLIVLQMLLVHIIQSHFLSL